MHMTRRTLLQTAAASAAAVSIGSSVQPAAQRSPTTSPTPRNSLKVGLHQHTPVRWALKENFQAFLEALDAASKSHVDLLVTPECQLDGYAAPDKLSTRERLFTVAQESGHSEYLDRVAQEARQRQMSIVFGFTQKEGDRLYNAAGLWDAQGQLVGVYHKTHIQTHDKQFDPGQSLPVFPSPWGPLGIMICADRRWPETARTLRLQGARLILCPSYGMRNEANEWWMRTRSYENDCFLAFVHPSVGFVADPAGSLAGKLENKDGAVLAIEIDLTRADHHAHLDDRRPELYSILTRS